MKKITKFMEEVLDAIVFPSLGWSSELFETLKDNAIFQFFLEILREMYQFFYQIISYMIS